jgi:formate-dependent nitrite reductase membrane component NrfD
MSLGTWVFSAFGATVLVNLLREQRRSRQLRTARGAGTWAGIQRRVAGLRFGSAELPRLWQSEGAPTHVARRLAPALADAAGLPLALLMSTYGGVLLSCTANPLWSRSTWLAPLFGASALGTGASGIGLHLALQRSRQERSERALSNVASAAHLAEFVTIAGFLRERGRLARPITRGKYAPHFWAGVAGLVASEVLGRLPFSGRVARIAKVASAVASLGAGLALRWVLVHGGQSAARDPELAQQITGGSQAAAYR